MKMHQAFVVLPHEDANKPSIRVLMGFRDYAKFLLKNPNTPHWLECSDENCGGKVYRHKAAHDRGTRPANQYTLQGFSHFKGAASATCQYSNKNDPRFLDRQSIDHTATILEVHRILATPIYAGVLKQDLITFLGVSHDAEEHYQSILKNYHLLSQGVLINHPRLATVLHVISLKPFVRSFASGNSHTVCFESAIEQDVGYGAPDGKPRVAVVPEIMNMVFASSGVPVQTHRYIITVPSGGQMEIVRDRTEQIQFANHQRLQPKRATSLPASAQMAFVFSG
jgi:hypothetical protein